MAEAVAGVKGVSKGAQPGLGGQILRVAWMSILLGVALEILILVLAAYSNTAGTSPKPFIADLAQKVSWGFLVCVGLAFGGTASKAREGVMGLLGLISAPLGFGVARSVHKGVLAALGIAGAGGGFPFLVAALKALEYGVLGAAVGRLSKRKDGTGSPLSAYLLAGSAIGLTFGLGITAVLLQAAPKAPTLVDGLAKGINEVVFPIGCSLVLYASGVLGKRLSA